MNPPRWLTVAVVGLILAGTIVAALQRDPWDPDETRYLQITHEMLVSANPFLLTISGQSYADKPPLHFWLLAAPVALLGERSALAGMIPSLIALLATGWATRRLGSAAGLTASGARWGGLLVMTALLPTIAAGGCRMDLAFTAWCALALCQLVRLAAGKGSGRRAHLLLWVWIAVGVLTKGPLALALPLLTVLALAPMAGRGLVRRTLVGWGPALALAIVGVWLVPAALMAGPSWFHTIVVEQSAGRMVSSFAHREPWWYHLATVPLTLMPWAPLAVGGLIASVRRRRELGAAGLHLPTYAVAGLALFSALSGKTFLYPIVLFPPLCLVAAWWFDQRPRGAAQRVCILAGGLTAVLIGFGLALAVAPRPDFQLGLAATLLLGGSLVLPGAAAAIAAIADRPKVAATALCLAVPLFAALGLQTLIPPFNNLLSLRPFGVAYNAADPTAEAGLAYAKVQPGFLLFTGRPFELLEEPSELEQALAAGRVVAINVKEARALEKKLDLQWRVVGEVPYRHTRIQLLQSPSSPTPLPQP